jgi:DNA-binding transcriptional ArsR family regulator
MSIDATEKRAFKDQIYAVFAEVAKAMGNGHRLELIDLLAQAERSVEDLAHLAGISVANASQHLQVLRRAGLVATRRDGTRVYYRLSDDKVVALWRALRTFGETEMPAVEHVINSYLGDRRELEAIGAAELRERLDAGEVVLLDVRPLVEYESGHIPGARSMPIDELDRRLGELPDDREIVAYCRGRYCVYSDEAVRLLRARGHAARRFEHSARDWQHVA